jgi:hypothetical protein
MSVMRELKFRAWDKQEKQMMKVSAISLENKEIGVKDFRTYHFFRIKNIELMQYTGLKDKNGTEIYEGDVIKVERDGIIYRVEWIHGGFGLEPRYNSPFYPRLGNVELREKIEVIGNIHENPEFLEEK